MQGIFVLEFETQIHEEIKKGIDRKLYTKPASKDSASVSGLHPGSQGRHPGKRRPEGLIQQCRSAEREHARRSSVDAGSADPAQAKLGCPA